MARHDRSREHVPTDYPESELSMTAERPKGTSARKRTWVDPRFLVGVVLILVSVAGVTGIVSTASATTTAFAAANDLVPGDRISAADLVATSVRLENVRARYLVPGDLPDEGLIITKPISAGELVPTSAVGATAGLDVASIVVTATTQVPESVSAGATVDIWAAGSLGTGLFGPPSVIVPGATVVRVITDDGIVAERSGATVELLVPRLRIARLLAAIANDDALSIVPAAIPAIG